MSWEQRAYYQYPGSGRRHFGRLPAWSVTTWLIAINVAVFALDRLLWPLVGFPPLTLWGHFSAWTAVGHLEAWRFLSFQFLHANIWHLFFNMLGLYFFGPLVESYLGSKRFLGFYLLCGVAGAVVYLLLWMVGLLITLPYIPLVGASAGIFGVLLAGAFIAPDAWVMLLFPPIPLRLKTLAWVLLGIAAFTVLTDGRNAGGEAAHLGGAALGLVLIRYPRVLNIFNISWRRPRPHLRYTP